MISGLKYLSKKPFPITEIKWFTLHFPKSIGWIFFFFDELFNFNHG